MLRDRLTESRTITFEEIVRKSQRELKQALVSELRRMGYRPTKSKGFCYGAGTLPVLLVAHLDTVHREPVKTICTSRDGQIVMSPQGIGGDDRAGVYMILQIIKQHRCHVLFCEDEEVGGIGAQKFVESHIRPEVNYMVELDRRGADDAVFYDCDNREFTDFVCGFGFREEFGSFSDISIIAPELGIAAVNLSAGYYNEHSKHEFVDLNIMEQNIQRVCKMVSTPSGRFEYVEAIWAARQRLHNAFDGWWDGPGWEPSQAVYHLKAAAGQFGLLDDEVDFLLECGYEPDEIELMLNSPQELRNALYQAMYEEFDY